jgi:transcriptional regulator with XRE-family HTH domain
MKTSYAQRLRQAVAHAKTDFSKLARRINVSPQAIQYLANPGNEAQGSEHTAAIARECRVNVDWLANGLGEMVSSEEERLITAFRGCDAEARHAILVMAERMVLERQRNYGGKK